jgi:hypothetical protein
LHGVFAAPRGEWSLEVNGIVVNMFGFGVA